MDDVPDNIQWMGLFVIEKIDCGLHDLAEAARGINRRFRHTMPERGRMRRKILVKPGIFGVTAKARKNKN